MMAQSALIDQAQQTESVQQYSRQQLESCTRPELWDICRQKNLKCFPKTVDCIEAILSLQSAKIADAEVKEIETIAFDNDKYLVVLGDRTLAHITHDPEDFATQAWVVEINGEEAHRAATVAKCENWVKWHYKNSTLPVHDEWLTAREELNTYIEEQAEEVAPELPATEVKVARELNPGDKVVLDGEIWKIDRINRRFVQYQVWQSEVHGVRFHLTLLPNDYQYQPFQGEPTDWEAARQHEFKEADRFVNTAKYLEPCGEAEFDVVMKAVLPMPDTTNLIGYDFCLANDVQFKQRTGQSGTVYWYGSAPHYYGQPGREYRTAGFPELKKTIKVTLEYLAKCNARGADEIMQQLNEEVEALAPQEQPVALEPLSFVRAVKELVPVAFAFVVAVGMMGSAIASEKKKIIRPSKNPDALKEQILSFQKVF